MVTNISSKLCDYESVEDIWETILKTVNKKYNEKQFRWQLVE